MPKVICWNFGDGRDTCIEYAQNFSGPYTVRHRYNVPGTYTVCIKITYYGGCEAYKCKPIVVTRPDECRADFERITINTTANPFWFILKHCHGIAIIKSLKQFAGNLVMAETLV